MARHRILILLTIICGSAVLASAQTDWQRVSDFRFNWNGHRNVRVTLEIPSQWNGAGDFTRVRIRIPGHEDFTINNSEGWVKYNSKMASVSPQIHAKKNLLPSRYMLALRASSGRTLLFLTGYSYASSPGSLDVLEISATGKPHLALHQEELGLRDLLDLNHDGLADVIGYPCLSQEFGNGLLTYDPFNVYSLAAAPGGRAALSIPLSRNYNLHHYYGWAGPNCSEKTVVVLHPPGGGKPLVIGLRDAQRMIGSPQ